MRRLYSLILILLVSVLSFAQTEINCGHPTIKYYDRNNQPYNPDEGEFFAREQNSFWAKVLSFGYGDTLCAVDYVIYKDGDTIQRISDYGEAGITVRSQGSAWQTLNLENGSGSISVSVLMITASAFSLGIFDGYCPGSYHPNDTTGGRSRPFHFHFSIDEYGEYRINMKMSRCTNPGSNIPFVNTGYTNAVDAAGCCGPAVEHKDKIASTCENPVVIFEQDLVFDVVSTKILAHPQGGFICPGESKTLSVTAETQLPYGITYQWYRNNEAIEGATSSTYTATESGTYYCMLYDRREYRQTNDAVVEIPSEPVANVGDNPVICSGQNLEISMSECDSYLWSNGSTEPSITVESTGTYSVTTTYGGRCTATRTINVGDDPNYNLITDENVKICAGNSITETLTVDNATNIVWNGDETLNQSSLVITEAGNYTVRATVGYCVYEDALTVRIPQYELIAADSVEICEGDSHEIALNGEEVSNVVWNSDPSSNAFTTSFSTPGTYRVTAEYDGCPFADSLVLSYKVMPTVDVPEIQVLCADSTINLTMPVCDSYLWSDNSTERTLSVNEAGTYSVTMTYNGCSFSKTFTIADAPTYNLLNEENVVLCAGNSVTETLTVDNATNIVWNGDESLNQSALVITEAGSYTVTAMVGSCVYEDALTVRTPQYELIAIDSVEICEGDSHEITFNGEEVSNIVWNSDPSSNALTTSFSTPGTYRVTAEYDGCPFADSIVLSYKVMPTVEVPESQILCADSTINLTMPVCDSYLWSDNSTERTLSVNEAGTYSVTMTYNGCNIFGSFDIVDAIAYNLIEDEVSRFCYATTTTISVAVEEARNIVWNGDASLAQTSMEISEGGTYTVEADVDVCHYTDQIVVTQTENQNLVVADTVYFCYGTTETLALAFDNAENIVWNGNEASNGVTFVISESGTYAVAAVIDECSYVDEVVAIESPAYNLIEFESVPICHENSVTINLALDNTENIVWNNNPLQTGTSYEASEAGTYTVIADIDGCHYYDTINVVAAEDYELIANETIRICYGETETIAIAHNSAQNIVWNGDAANNELTFEISEAGTYTVEADIDVCHYTDQVVATQTENHNLLADSVNFCYGTNASLVIVADDVSNIVWNNDVSLNDQILIINEGGTYSVAADIDGCRYYDDIVAVQSENHNLISADSLGLCYGASETLALDFDNATNIIWNDDASLDEPTLIVDEGGTYMVSAEIDGCMYHDQIIVVEGENKNLISADSVSFCYGATATVSLSVDNVENIVWNGDETLTEQTLVVDESGTYTVSADVDGCTYIDQIVAIEGENINLVAEDTIRHCYGGIWVTLSVDNATNIVWSEGLVEGDSILIGSSFAYYDVSANVDGCTYTDMFVEIGDAYPNTGLNNAHSYEIQNVDTVITITANEGYDYLWSNGSTGNVFSISCDTIDFPYSEIVSFRFTSEMGCEYEDSIEIVITKATNLVNDNILYNWSVAPNPNDGKFSVFGPEYYKAELYSSDGRLICEFEGTEQSFSYLMPGVYIIKVYSGQIVQTIRFIVGR